MKTQIQSCSTSLPIQGSVAPVEERLLAALHQVQNTHAPFQPGRAVVVGVSGGADSVCLLHLLQRKAAAWSVDLHVAHLDHQLRPTSANDAAFVADLARRWGLPFHLHRLQPGELTQSGKNIEAVARQERYRFLSDVARSTASSDQSPLIAVAHTADDQAETLLMHLLRGSGLDGLAGMQPYRLLDSTIANEVTAERVWLVRPLLDVQRTEILRYLDIHGLPWREDVTNSDLRFTRNWLRHEILPQLAKRYPTIRTTLTRTAAILSSEVERTAAIDQTAFQDLLVDTPGNDRIVLRRSDFCVRDVATQRGVLRRAWHALDAPPDGLTFAHIEELRTALPASGVNAGPFPLAAGIAWSAVDDLFSLHRVETLPILPDHPFLDSAWRQTQRALPISVSGQHRVGEWILRVALIDVTSLPADWQTNQDPWQVYLNRQPIRLLRLTTPQSGHQFMPLGLGGRHKSLGDLFTDRKIPPFLRAGWPLIVDGEDGAIVWVCGIQPAHFARITAQTTEVLHLHWKRKEDA